VSSVSQVPGNDDQLLRELNEALRAARAVPRDFIDAGKAAFAWHNIDAELAALTYDSAGQGGAIGHTVQTRAEPAALRNLTFAAPELTIELEVTDDAIRGQLVPPQRGEIEVEILSSNAVGTTAVADDVGYFVIRPVPTRSFRLCCHTAGCSVLTTWIAL
jgi:hypothetical protein